MPSTKLTEIGIEQAIKTGKMLKGRGITKILCSPYIRAQQTAQVIASELGLPTSRIEIVDELHERRLGDAEGKPKKDSKEWFFLRDDKVRGQEPTDEVIKRSLYVLKKIESETEHEVLVVVGHSVAGFYLLQLSKGNLSLEEFDPVEQLDNAGFIEVIIDK